MSVVINLKDVLNAQGGLLRSPSLAEDAAQTLRKMILLEKLPPGTALPERDLSQALGISRTPLREAIRLLAGEGLVQYTAARRPFVADPSLEEINDCLRIQGALEALAGELACTQASTQQQGHANEQCTCMALAIHASTLQDAKIEHTQSQN